MFDARFCGVALGLVGLASMAALALAASAPHSSSKFEVQSDYGKLPLSFEVNRGQTQSEVKFLARGRGYALFLTSTEAVLSLAKPRAHAHSQASLTSPPEASGTLLTLQVSGANPEPQVIGKDALPGRVNYLRGKDPAYWQTQIPTYAKVACQGIYPGVDLVYYGNQGQLEYDFVVAPGADPGVIKLVFRGADRIAIDAAGDLVLSTASGDIRMDAPVIYQETAGVRTTVAGGYVLTDSQQVSFEVAAHDPARPLVIDPVLVYSTYLGGSGSEFGFAIAVDDRGHAYVTGQTFLTEPTLTDAFVAKLDRNGNQLLYSTYFGGSGSDSGSGIAVDNRGDAYITGATDSPDLPTVNGVQPSLKGYYNAFVAKLDRNGDQLLYSTYLGGSGSEYGAGIAVDNLGSAYVAGYTGSSDFPTVHAVQRAFGGGGDVFVTKLNRDGNRLLYSTYLGGSGSDSGTSIALDNGGNAYVAGVTESPNFPIASPLQPNRKGGSDAFVAKLDRNGTRLLYSTYLGGGTYDYGAGIAVDNYANAYVTGYTGSTDFPRVNAVQPALRGESDAFLARLDWNGARLLYSTYLGGSETDAGYGIALDNVGHASVTGVTFSADFPIVNALQPAFGGFNTDAFVAKIDRDGDRLLYSTYLGGSGDEEGRGIAVDRSGNAYVAGFTGSTDFPTTANTVQPALGGDSDAFVVKLGR